MQEMRIRFPGKVVIRESVCFHSFHERWCCGETPDRLIGLEASLKVQVSVVLLESLKEHVKLFVSRENLVDYRCEYMLGISGQSHCCQCFCK